MHRSVLLAGLAVGCVLGARPGRSRFDRVATSMRNLRDTPTVQETAGVLQGQAAGLVSAARQTVSGRISGRRMRRRPGSFYRPEPRGADPRSGGTPAAGF